MKETPLEAHISTLVRPVIADHGLALVSVRVIGEGGSKNVQIMAEDPATRRLGIDQCADISKAVSALLDVEDPVEGHYRLEVSSPGIDRPLLTLEDFAFFTGLEARLETATPQANGQKRFKGILNGLSGETIVLETEDGETHINFADLSKARLVLNDALMRASENNFQSIPDAVAAAKEALRLNPKKNHPHSNRKKKR